MGEPIRDALRQRDRIAQTQIEALSSNGMQPLGGITDDGYSLTDERGGLHQRERVSQTFPRRTQPTEAPAEGLLQFAEERRVIQRPYARRFCGRQRPDGSNALVP